MIRHESVLPNSCSLENLSRSFLDHIWNVEAKLFLANGERPVHRHGGRNDRTHLRAYHAFVVNVVLPHTLVFACLIAFGETLCGISLVLGLFTEVAAIGGMFLTLNYWLTGAQYSSKWGLISLEAVVFFLSLFVLLLPTKGVWSLDSLIGRKRLRSPTVIGDLAHGKSS